jgi:NADH:quinone reductase (non-electrogenic)
VNGGVVAAGQVIGLIDDVPTCADLIERMVADCRAALARAQAWSHPLERDPNRSPPSQQP